MTFYIPAGEVARRIGGSGDDEVSDVTLSLAATVALSCRDDVPPSPLVNSTNTIIGSKENDHDDAFRQINSGTPPSTTLAMLPRQAAYVD